MSDLLIEDDDEPGAGGAKDAGLGGNAPEMTVSELSGRVKRSLEDAFGRVRVRGEVGRVSRPRSGHVYLDLKDDRAVIAGVVWRGVATSLKVKPEEGMEVIADGRITTFPGQSKYQIIIESLAPAGVGALMAMLEERRKKLAAEGLFSDEIKHAPPFLPETIGVVTSPSGAVIRDILHRLADRFPRRVLLWPVAVQGESAAGEVARAVAGFNALSVSAPIPRPDVLIVARGGGSVEDLWSFNEEIVVRAVAASTIPVISAIGHETDTTLIDFAADRRAPTPTAAAEMAVPVRGELLAALAGLEERRERAASRMIVDRRTRLRDLARALPRPEEIVGIARQRFDAVGERLPRALIACAKAQETRLARVASRLTPATLSRRLEAGAERTQLFGERLQPALARSLTQTRERLEKASRLLDVFSYKATLSRGYAAIRRRAGAGEATAEAGGVISSAAAVAPGAPLDIEFADGRVAVVAGDSASPDSAPSSTSPPKPAGKKPAGKKTSGEPQGSLF